jgi:phosphate-selective porin OprO/OprP
MTLGLNWYVNPYIRFMANYILVDNNDNATNNSGNLHADESSAANDDPQIFMLRAQVDF